MEIEEHHLFGNKNHLFPYELMDGIYEYKRELIGNFRFRYKQRLCSNCDNRKTWAMVYSIINGSKVQTGRVLMKAEPEFFDTLSEYVENRICVPQEEIVFYATIRADAVKHGEDVNAYYQSIMETYKDKD